MSKNFSENPTECIKAENIFKELNSADELRDWMYIYFDIRFPKGVVYPGSTHGPVDAMWRIYELFKTNQTESIPQVVMVSSRDSFKCQSKGSRLITKNGLKKIEDINIGDIVWTGFSWQKVNYWVDDGVKRGIKIKTNKGYEFTGTPIHRYWALRDGIEQWIESKDLNPETDLICINNKIDNKFVIDKEKFDLGYFLGILIGDGSLSFLDYKKNSPFFGLTTVDSYIKNFFFDFCQKKWSYVPKVCSDRITYRVSKQNAINFLLNECGVKPSLSYNKTIPGIVWTDQSISLGFINGVFDTDGTFEKSKKNMLFSLSAEKLLKEMQILLLSLGIISGFRKAKKLVKFKDPNLKQNHLTCHLTINSHEVVKLQKLGFVNKSKKAGSAISPEIPDAHDTIPWVHLEFLKEILKLKKINRNIRGRKIKVPINLYRSSSYLGINVNKLSCFILWAKETIEMNGFEKQDIGKVIECIKRLELLLNNKWLSFTKEDIDESHFYDITVENDHCYWSNGSISHNTLSAAAIEVLLFLHFRLPMAHAAAIKFQAGAAVGYANNFFRKVKPYIEYHGWSKTSDNKTLIEWLTPEGDEIWLKVLTASKEGFNATHCPFLVLDELDQMDPEAFRESRMIPSSYKGRSPLILILSTRKFAAGLMEEQIQDTPKMGGEVFRWNIVDVAEKIPDDIARTDLPRVVRYVTAKSLPMKNISEDSFNSLSEKEQQEFERIEAYAGIAEHPMLSVMRNYLVDRPHDDTGFLYKKITAVHNNFKLTDLQTADAQLLCNKPSSSGLVYPRFEESRNVLNIPEAYKKIFDIDDPKVTLEEFRDACHHIGGEFVGGGDWGYTDYTSLVVMLLIGGEVILVDAFCADQLELDDIVKYAKELNGTWNVSRWYVDQAYPAYIKTLRRHGLTVPDFKKVVEDGIAALQYRISDSSGIRRFFVLSHPNTHHVIESFGKYRWSIDGKGDVIENKPYHDNSYISDVQDSIRYPMQVLFGKPKRKPQMTISMPKNENKPINDNYGQQIMDYVKATTGAEIKNNDKPISKKKGLVWSV